jgi:hypothetical protein
LFLLILSVAIVIMLTASVGLIVVLAVTFCDRTFGAAFFQGRVQPFFGLEQYSQRPRMELLSKEKNMFETLRGGSNVESPSENEDSTPVEDILYLPGLLEVLVQHSDHVR